MTQTTAFKAAAHFFNFAEVAASHGGFWVSAAGGTANVVAGVISRATGVTYAQAHDALDAMGRHLMGEDWYCHLAAIQPWPWLDMDAAADARWDAATLAKAACRKAVA